MPPTNCGITFYQDSTPRLDGRNPDAIRAGITNLVGTFSDGNIVTLSGGGFGSRSNTPLYYDDYRGATEGWTSIQAGLSNLGGNASHEPIVRTDRSLSGGKSLRMDYATGFDSMFPRRGITGFDSKTLFYSSWGYYSLQTAGTLTNPTFKRARFGANEFYSGNPKMRETLSPSWSTGQVGGPSAFDRGVIRSDGTLARNEIGNENPHADQWNRTDHWLDLGDVGVANAEYRTWCNQVANDVVTNDTFRYAGATENITWCISDFDGMDSYGTDNAWQVWMDQMYIDTTMIRVELGNASTYAACTKSYIQPSVIWSPTSVQINVRPGDLVGSAYLFVLNSLGAPVSAGFPVSII